MNLKTRLQDQLSEPKLRLLVKVGEIGAREGMATFLVGGAVRDLLLEQANSDLDVVVEGDAAALAQKVRAALGGEVLTHARFGTARFTLADLSVDLATSRTEIYYKPGVLPTVRPAPIEDDLARRDFSINAMAASLHPEHFGDLLDPFKGQSDLSNNLVRVLHEKSFVDDATRILRGIRYEQRLTFQFDPETLALIQKHLRMLDTISGDRVRHEIERWLAEPTVALIMNRAHQLGVLHAIYLDFPWNDSLRDQFAKAAESHAPDSRLFLALLAFAAPPEGHAGLKRRLSMAGSWTVVVDDAGKLVDRLPVLRQAGLTPSALYHQLHGLDEVVLRASLMAGQDATVKARVGQYLDEIRNVTSRLNGSDLLRLGVPRGPKMGEFMQRLLDLRLDGITESSADEEAQVHGWLKANDSVVQRSGKHD